MPTLSKTGQPFVAQEVGLPSAVAFYPNMGPNARTDGASIEVSGPLAGADGGNKMSVAIGFQSNLGSQGGDVFENVSPTVRVGTQSSGKCGFPPAVAVQAMRESGPGWWTETTVAGTLDANMGASGHANRVATIAVPQQPYDIANCMTRGMNSDLNEGQTPVLAFSSKDSGADAGPLAPTLRSGNHDASHANGGVPPAVVVSPSLTASNDPSRSPQSTEVTQQVDAVPRASTQVRRLTPTECERLQGFPDGYTNIPLPTKKRAQKKRETDEEYAAYLAGVPDKRAADGPRYKALGNSMAVPVMRWLGERIQMVESARKGKSDD